MSNWSNHKPEALDVEKVRVGLIGYGMAGSVFHAPLVSAVAGLELAKVVSSDAAKVHRDYPAVAVTDSVESLLADSAIDVVVVASPNPTHYDYAKLALTAGKHVVVDKPFAIRVSEADALIALARQQQRLLTVFQNRRYDNDFLTVQKIVEEGLLGDILSFEARYDMFRPRPTAKWKEHAGEGSGALYDLGPHLIDQVLQLFGMPTSLFADLAWQRETAEVDDYFHLVLGYGRLRVVLQSCFVVKQPGPHFQVHGTKGSLIKYGMDSQQADLQQRLKPGHPAWGLDSEENYAELTVGTAVTASARIETIRGSYETFYQQLHAAVTKGAPLPVKAEEARQVLRVIELALQSANEGRVLAVTATTSER